MNNFNNTSEIVITYPIAYTYFSRPILAITSATRRAGATDAYKTGFKALTDAATTNGVYWIALGM